MVEVKPFFTVSYDSILWVARDEEAYPGFLFAAVFDSHGIQLNPWCVVEDPIGEDINLPIELLEDFRIEVLEYMATYPDLQATSNAKLREAFRDQADYLEIHLN